MAQTRTAKTTAAKKTTTAAKTAAKAAPAKKTTVARKTTAAAKTAPAKKATAAKSTPAKRATAKAAALVPPPEEVLEGTVEGVDDQDDGEGLRTALVPFHGRQIEVRFPTIEQLTIYKRVADRFAQLKTDDKAIDAKTAVGHFDRALRIITSIVVKPEDVAWIEDEMLDGRLTLPDAAPLIRQAMDKLQEANADAGNRAARRARARRARA